MILLFLVPMITILYSSGGGNTRMVTEYIAEKCAGFSCEFITAVSATIDDLNRSDIVFLAAPTYDHGVLHTPYERFLDKAQGISLEKKYVVVGLGDNKYDNEYNVEAVPILENFVKEHGGTLLCDSLRINKNPITQLDSVVDNRIQETLLPALKTL